MVLSSWSQASCSGLLCGDLVGQSRTLSGFLLGDVMADKKKEPRLDDKRFKLTEDMKLEIWNGYLVGVSVSDIAESMGLSKQTVYRVLRAKKK